MKYSYVYITLLAAASLQAQQPAFDFVDALEVQPPPAAQLPEAQLRAPAIAPHWKALNPTVAPADALVPREPPQVGYVRPAPVDAMPSDWQPAADGGLVLRVELRSLGAAALRVKLADLFKAPGMELRVYDPGWQQLRGPYRSVRQDEDGAWWSPTITGDTIGLEFYLPAGVTPPQSPPRVTAVAHIFCDHFSECHNGPNIAMGCHNDVTCFPTWANSDAVAVGAMGFISGGGCFFCTGALLNRQPGDLSPLFMTAHHCISNQSEANSLEVRWLYQTSVCNGAPPGFTTVPINNGSLLLKRHPDSDWTLLGLYDPPLVGTYLGWSSGGWDSGDSATGVHHPAGTFKRISFGTSDGSSNEEFCDNNGQNCFDADVWDVDYSNGTTEGGSSGSPIFDSARRVRGTLSGGESSCAPVTKHYGRLDLAYANLRYYMGNSNIASPVFVHAGIPGDPGNNGSGEQGTSSLPFNTVFEATFAVRANDVLQIAPGTYAETMRIWRPMRLERWNAGAGVVRIGG